MHMPCPKEQVRPRPGVRCPVKSAGKAHSVQREARQARRARHRRSPGGPHEVVPHVQRQRGQPRRRLQRRERGRTRAAEAVARDGEGEARERGEGWGRGDSAAAGRRGPADKETRTTAPTHPFLGPTHTQTTHHTRAPRPRAGGNDPTQFAKGSAGDGPGPRQKT